MRFGLRSKSVENVNDVKASLITSRRIIFIPSVDLKDELAKTAVQITCYDRNGELVKRVTTDAGEVEDPEGDETGEGDGKTDGSNENQNQNENGSNQNQGGGNENENENQNPGGGGTEDGTDES